MHITTRLRLVLADNRAVDEVRLKRLGALGTVRTATQELQVVFGPIADQVAGEIRAALRSASAMAKFPEHDASALLAALGGRVNIIDIDSGAGRILIRTARPELVDPSALTRLDIRSIAHSGAASMQLLIAGPVEGWITALHRKG